MSEVLTNGGGNVLTNRPERWVSGTFVELEGNGNQHISRWGTYGFVQGSPSGGMEIGWGVPDIGSSLSRIAFGLGVGGTTAALTGLLAVGLYGAAAPLHARSSTGPQQIWEYADGVDARLTVDPDGDTVILATGTIMLNGDNRAAYNASPTTENIRDILISFGLMAAS